MTKIKIVVLETGHVLKDSPASGDRWLEKISQFLPPRHHFVILAPRIGLGHWQKSGIKVTYRPLTEMPFDNHAQPLLVFLAYCFRAWFASKLLNSLHFIKTVYSSTDIFPDVLPAYISKYAISKATKNTQAKLCTHDAALAPWPYPGKFFDVITIFDVIEHVELTRVIFAEAYRVLKPGGFIYATTQNDQGRWGALMGIIFPDDPTHINKKNATAWKKELIETGFRQVEINGVIIYGFPPSPGLRMRLQKIGIPTTVRPIFFPIKYFTGVLIIFAQK